MGSLKTKSMGYLNQSNSKTVQCRICGNEIDLNSIWRKHRLAKRIKEEHVCLNCAFWIEQLEIPERIVIDKKCYTAIDDKVGSLLRVQKKALTAYVLKDGNKPIAMKDIQLVGEVPEHFLSHFPNNAIFISYKTYRQLKESTFKCKLKGCWDRYYCYRYDADSELEPWNIVPMSHKIGDEQCKSFINKFKLL